MRRRKRDSYYTSLLSECPDGNHNRCKIIYYNKYRSDTRDLCCCYCHNDNNKPSIKEKEEDESVIGIGTRTDALVFREGENA
jgi:hypothetical protein